MQREAAAIQATAVIADLERFDECERVMAAVEGPIDILINNVRRHDLGAAYAEYAEAQIEAEIRRSLFPTLWACRAVLPYMIEQRRA